MKATDVLAALESGDRVMVTHPDPMRPDDRTRYTLASGGGRISSRTFVAILPKLRPVQDGLFGDQCPQTWELA